MCDAKEVRDIVSRRNRTWERVLSAAAGVAVIIVLPLIALNFTLFRENIAQQIQDSAVQSVHGMGLLRGELISNKTMFTQQIESRNKLIDERCKMMIDRVEHVEGEIDKYHNDVN